MKNIKKARKTKMFLEAAIVIAVALVLITSSSAVITNNEKTITKPFERVTRTNIQSYEKITPMGTSRGTDVLLSFAEGDDVLPSITIDPEGNTIVTWTNTPSFSEGNMAILWSDDPTDPMSWDGWLITLSDPNSWYWDTAKVVGPNPGDFEGLMGVYMAMDDELSGFYLIDDITTDPSFWEFYTWDGGAPEPEYACIADMGYYQDLNYPEVIGPFNFYIYHEIYAGYDIPSCPICFHTGIVAGSGVGYFDAQSEEKTAPAKEPDLVDLEDRFHTAIQYNNETIGPKIVWKKIVPSEEPDYEFTPYQETLADGTNPAIAAFENSRGGNVAIVYVDNGVVKCLYSSDDGENWATSTIGPGEYPDIYAYDGKFYASYINNGNLYVVNSTDGGANWGAATQINDVDGTVVAEENSVDMHEGGIVWVDSRSRQDYDIYYDVFFEKPPEPAFEVIAITGGIGVSVEFENVGDGTATNVDWNIKVTGGFFGRINVDRGDRIPSMPPRTTTTVGTGLFLGIGSINIQFTVDCDEGVSETAGATGRQIIIFTRVS